VSYASSCSGATLGLPQTPDRQVWSPLQVGPPVPPGAASTQRASRRTRRSFVCPATKLVCAVRCSVAPVASVAATSTSTRAPRSPPGAASFPSCGSATGVAPATSFSSVCGTPATFVVICTLSRGTPSSSLCTPTITIVLSLGPPSAPGGGPPCTEEHPPHSSA